MILSQIKFILFSAAVSLVLMAVFPLHAPAEKGSELTNRWGVQVLGVRLSATGYMLDFRYKVVDTSKALPLVDRKIKPYLVHQKSGAKFIVPVPAKVGPLRQTARKLKEGRIYFIMFANPGRYVKAGDKVTVVIGDFKAEDLVVE